MHKQQQLKIHFGDVKDLRRGWHIRVSWKHTAGFYYGHSWAKPTASGPSVPLPAPATPTQTNVHKDAGLWECSLQKKPRANTFSFHPECPELTKEPQHCYMQKVVGCEGVGNHGTAPRDTILHTFRNRIFFVMIFFLWKMRN